MSIILSIIQIFSVSGGPNYASHGASTSTAQPCCLIDTREWHEDLWETKETLGNTVHGYEASQFDLLFKIPFQRCKIQVCTCLLTVSDMISILSIAGFCGEDRGECYEQLSR